MPTGGFQTAPSTTVGHASRAVRAASDSCSSARASAANARVYALNRTNNGGRKVRATSKAPKENARAGNAISRIHLVTTSLTHE